MNNIFNCIRNIQNRLTRIMFLPYGFEAECKQTAKVIHFNRIITHYEEFKPLFCVFCAGSMFWSGE